MQKFIGGIGCFWDETEYQRIPGIISTECGLEKHEILKRRKGVFNKIRFYWFVFFANIRDHWK